MLMWHKKNKKQRHGNDYHQQKMTRSGPALRWDHQPGGPPLMRKDPAAGTTPSLLLTVHYCFVSNNRIPEIANVFKWPYSQNNANASIKTNLCFNRLNLLSHASAPKSSSQVKSSQVCFIVNSSTCTAHTYRELKLRYSQTLGAYS